MQIFNDCGTPSPNKKPEYHVLSITTLGIRFNITSGLHSAIQMPWFFCCEISWVQKRSMTGTLGPWQFRGIHSSVENCSLAAAIFKLAENILPVKNLEICC